MYAITGAFGQTGLALSQALLDAGHAFRMIVRRDDAQAEKWRRKGAEVVVADIGNPNKLAQAFQNVDAAYLMNPPAYFTPNLYTQARHVHAILIDAARFAKVPYLVALSSVGAQHAAGTGNILTTHHFEQQLQSYSGNLTILRAANFMENWAWSIQSVKENRVLPSMFHPIDKSLPMVSALDIGHCAAKLLSENSMHRRIVELHGPKNYSPLDASKAFSEILGHHIQAVEYADTDWVDTMLCKGFPQATVDAFIEMFAGFNSGLISFEGSHEIIRGKVTLHEAISAMLKPEPKS